MADIRKMLLELHGEGGILKFQDTHRNEQNGQSYPIFCLPKRETLILVSGYSIPMRARIVDRCEALETGKAKPAMVAQPYSAAVEAIQVADALAKMLRLEGSARLDVAQKAVKFERLTFFRWSPSMPLTPLPALAQAAAARPRQACRP
jgi:phage regulator Rha-like protein